MAYFPLSKCEKGNVPCIPNKQKQSGVGKRWAKNHTQQQSYRVVITNYIKMVPASRRERIERAMQTPRQWKRMSEEDVKRNKVNMITVESVSDAHCVGVLNKRLSDSRTIYRCLAFVCRLHLKHPGLFNGTLSTFICIRSFCYRSSTCVNDKRMHSFAQNLFTNVAHSTNAQVLKNWVGFIQNNFRRKGLALSCAE